MNVNIITHKYSIEDGYYFRKKYFINAKYYMIYVWLYINELITQSEYKENLTIPNEYEKQPFFQFLNGDVIGSKSLKKHTALNDTTLIRLRIPFTTSNIFLVYKQSILKKTNELYKIIFKTQKNNSIFSHYESVFYEYAKHSYFMNTINNFVALEIKHNYTILKNIQLQLKQTRNEEKKVELVKHYHNICNINDIIANSNSTEKLKKMYNMRYNKVIKLCVKYVNNLYWFYILKRTYHIAINKILRSHIYNYGLGLKLSIKNCGLELIQ